MRLVQDFAGCINQEHQDSVFPQPQALIDEDQKAGASGW